MLSIKPLETKKTNLPQTKLMKSGVINKFPSMLLNVGRSGSGKSTVVMHMLTQDGFLKDFFHKIYYFSPTAKLDDLTKHLKLNEKYLIDNPTEEKLQEIIDNQQKLIEKYGIEHIGKNSRVLIIFDDIISSPRFLTSPAMIQLATAGRHFLISSIINTQSYTKVPRAIRLQANGIILFPSSENEIKLLADDYTPPRCKKQTFLNMVDYATSGKHDFLYINASHPVETRFRRCFLEYLTPC